MQNVLSLPADRRRPQRVLGVPRSGARILFFTGVRYCRDEPAEGYGPAPAFHGAPAATSDRVFDAAAH